ncbi:hypothetical protein PLESTF_000934700 [Pleodorina starrii]|nr:hypothetical protein PLESTF_000934700 [Pleodorina starrii]
MKMMQRLRCCFRCQPSPLDEVLRVPTFPPELGPRFSFTQDQMLDTELLDVLLNSSKAADAHDWAYRCILQLDAAASLLRAYIRMFIAREDGRFELLLGSVGAVLTGWYPVASAEAKQQDVHAGKLDSNCLQATLGSHFTDSQLFRFDASGPARVRYACDNTVAVVPLSCGTGCFGALLLTPEDCDSNPLDSAEARPVAKARTDFASREPHLRQLGMALSLALTPELPALRRLAASLARLTGSGSLRETIVELCDALSYHVRQRFLLEPAVRAALVAEADATTAFLLDVAGAPSSCHQGRRLLLQQHQLQPQPTVGSSLLGASGTLLQFAPPPKAATASASAARAAPPPPQLPTAPWDPVPQCPRSTLGPAARSEVTRLSAMTRPSDGKSPSALPLPLSLLRSKTAGSVSAAAAAEGCPPDGASTPPAQPLRLSPGNVAAACEAAGGSVVARPFQLSYSLLLRLQMQQPRMQGIAVRDCARLVQDVNQPSRDVCLLMGSTGIASTSTVAAAASGILCDSACQPSTSYGFRDSDGVPAPYQLYGGGGLHSGGGAVQSLALVGCDAGDGVTLAFYVCFPHRLPGQLVEAVRDSCQRLLERVLLRAVASKVTGDLAAELGALRRGTPGTFAIVQMPMTSYSRLGSTNLGVTSPGGSGLSGGGGGGVANVDTAPNMTGSTALLGSDLASGFHLATTASHTITVIPPPLQPAPAGASAATAAVAAAAGPPPAALQRAARAHSAVAAAQRPLMLQLEAGGGAAAAGAGGLHGPVSARVIASAAAAAAAGGGSSGGVGTGAAAAAGSSLSDLFSHSSSTSASRSRSATTIMQPRCGGAAVPSKLTAADHHRRKTLAGASGGLFAATTTTTTLSEVMELPPRGRVIDASLLNGGGGAESWLQITAAATSNTTGPASASVAADAIQAFLSSSQCVSGSQLHASAQEADVIRRAASVLVVRDPEAEARGCCQQQLGAMVSSVRDSITIAAAAGRSGIGSGSCGAVLSTAAAGRSGVGGGSDGAVLSTAAAAGPVVAVHLYDAADAIGALVSCRRAATSGGYLGWEDGFGAAAAAAAISPAAATGVGAAAACGLDSEAADVADLRLVAKLGQGSGGCVFLGQMAGGLEVAVKLLELPNSFNVAHFVDQFSPGPAAGSGRARGGGGGGGGGGSVDSELGSLLAAEAARQQVRARRCLLQSATELAMLTSISHPHIVQVYGICANVVLETRAAPDGGPPTYRLRHRAELFDEEEEEEEEEEAGTGADCDKRRADYSNVCSAVCMTLCDLGSLATALTRPGFPNRLGAASPAAAAAAAVSTHGSLQAVKASAAAAAAAATAPSAADVNSLAFGASILKHMRSVYLTLLEVALALRYLHGRHIVHRDLKPGNILLKSRTPTPGDPRGFTTKLADFGLALVLDREGEQQSGSDLSRQNHTQQQQQQPPAAGVGPAGYSGPATGLLGHGEACSAPAAAGRYALPDQACGTVDHMAPEACRGKGSRLTAAVDVYSFGVVMLEAVTAGRRPYGAMPAERIARLVVAGTRPIFPAWVPQQFRSLAEACWAADPAQRPTAAQLVVALRQQLQRYPPPTTPPPAVTS